MIEWVSGDVGHGPLNLLFTSSVMQNLELLRGYACFPPKLLSNEVYRLY